MDMENALQALKALSQRTRMTIFRLLVAHEPTGLPVGVLAEQLRQPQNTISTHLAILARAGLVAAQRQGRLRFYRACLPKLQALTGFMLEECCTQHPGQCSASATLATHPCAPPPSTC
ncbi:helix-turn-helix transcriptional regulator [Formicincola oecophyllae]|uniref:Helix-turn-helix transcriptional regulator n=1 Tax=Formicincola oecophyllae TaxID=2558361 RepID=A0A4Y6U688_9PROT|nr:metalloregulator ArsR/SmtB family transcription factor [Formicincola oecophyllae]QDH12863.1 helix-turn-helix transcriptional regulator [Formicincola oecophyllae]